MGVIDSAVAWWSADRYDPAVDGQSWLDQSGNGHHMQFGSTAGVDANDPVFEDSDLAQFCYAAHDVYTSANWLYGTDLALVSGVNLDLDARFFIRWNDFAPPSQAQGFARGMIGAQINWEFSMHSDGTLKAWWVDGGSSGKIVYSTVALSTAVSEGQDFWVRLEIDIDNGAGGHDVKFYTSTDGDSWAQLGATVNSGAGTTSFRATAGSKDFFLLSSGSFGGFKDGRLYRAVVIRGGVTQFDLDCTDPIQCPMNGVTWTESINGYTINRIVPAWGTERETHRIAPGRFFWGDAANNPGWIGVDDPAFRFTNAESFTIAFCALKYVYQNGNSYALRRGVGSSYFYYMFMGNNPNLSTRQGGTTQQLSGATIMTDGIYTIFGVRDAVAGTFEFYQNGVNAAGPTAKIMHTLATTPQLPSIGGVEGFSLGMRNGNLFRHVALFRSALSAGDASDLHDEMIAGFWVPPGNGGGAPGAVHPLNSGQLQHGALGLAPRHWRA